MTKKNKQDKTNFINVFLSKVEGDSHAKDAAEEFLRSEDRNVDRMKEEGLNRIKQMQIQIQARKTEEEMAGIGPAAQRATDWVDQLLSSISFSLPDLVRQEELTVAFSNMDTLSAEEIRIILIKHFTLKFMQENL